MIALQSQAVESLAYQRCDFDSRSSESFRRRIYPASLWNVGASTLVLTCALNNTRRGTWCLPTPIELESRHTALVRRKNCIVNIDIVRMITIDLNFTSFVVLETVWCKMKFGYQVTSWHSTQIISCYDFIKYVYYE